MTVLSTLGMGRLILGQALEPSRPWVTGKLWNDSSVCGFIAVQATNLMVMNLGEVKPITSCHPDQEENEGQGFPVVCTQSLHVQSSHSEDVVLEDRGPALDQK